VPGFKIKLLHFFLVYDLEVIYANCTSLSPFVKVKETVKNYPSFWIVLTLAVPWMADSGAYFVGKFLGKHKLCPSVSPKKTIEGSIGGILTTCLVLYLLNAYCGLLPNYSVFIIGVVISIVGQIGDLIESLIKRFCGVKDSGNILPGHGGILDRFDSIMLAAPFMYYCICVVQYLG